jgi:TfoX/Sxy family transcriptional regulator of competence genes
VPYDPQLALRVERQLAVRGVAFQSKKMMGGLAYLVNDKMCVGIEKSRLMVRLAPEEEADALAQPGCKPMDFTGSPMRGHVFVDAAALDDESTLGAWLQRALDFNPRAKSSKKSRREKS